MALPGSLRLPGVDALRLPTRIPLRLRVFFRSVFGLLTLATVALALSVLQDEKQRSYANYRDLFAKTQAQIASRLRHPTGQLALLNPAARGVAGAPVTPLLLPFAAIDFDDKAKAQQAVEMAGCLVQYVGDRGDDASLCVAVGNNPLAGGFIYTVGSFASDELLPRRIGERDLSTAHRVRVSVAMRGQTWRWLAPFETPQDATSTSSNGARGRLTGFAEDEQGRTADRPVRDFRGWLWQDARCLDGGQAEHCLRRSFFSLRLPVELFRDELQAQRGRLVWPPADLDRIAVRLQVLPPGADAKPLFDSAQAGAQPPFALADLASLLLPGETLRIRKLGGPAGAELATLTGHDDHSEPVSPLLDKLIRRLPVDGYDLPLQATDTIATASGRYELALTGDVKRVNRGLSRVATRVGWFVGALLAAIAFAWAAIELRVIHRITVLTKRAAAVSRSIKQDRAGGDGGELSLDVADLRGSDELGLLAGTLADLMQRVNDDVKREHIRAAQEKDQWHAVGHEIMSPLQSLMVLHGNADDPSHRYIQRMQQAVRVLYGQASPSEAFEATTLGVQALDLNEFLQHVAENAPHAGIAEVHYPAQAQAVLVKGDGFALEDVVTHVLRNADRHRTPGTAITLALSVQAHHAELRIHNQGAPIADDMLDRIFEYGVSAAGTQGMAHRGQGLFVARTYMAKMGGTIEACNQGDGVAFVLRLQRA